MTFLAGAAVGAVGIIFLEVCFFAGFCWAAPKAWRWAKRNYAEGFGLDWSED